MINQSSSANWIWIVCGISFGIIGPLLRLLPIYGISEYDPKDPGVAIYWMQLDLYLWPTHLLAWASAPWGTIAIVSNILIFLVGAYIIFSTHYRKIWRRVLIAVILLWSILVALFLAGFRISNISILPFISGLLFYGAFIYITDYMAKLMRK